MNHRSQLFAAGVLLWASGAAAQSSRVERIVPARVVVEDKCPSSPAGIRGANEVGPLVGAAISIGAGLASDMVRAGMEAIGGALDEASKERAVGGQGRGTFPFYLFTVTENRTSLEPNLGVGLVRCVVLALNGIDGKAPVLGTPSAAVNEWLASRGWATTALYAEAELISHGDSFSIRPVYLWYGQALPGFPKQFTSSELHMTFSVPASSEDNASAFAIARLPLPAVQPGTVLNEAQLRFHAGPALPLRPTVGAVDSRKQRLDGVLGTIAAEELAISEGVYTLANAQEDLKLAEKPTDDLKAKPRLVRRENAAANRRLVEARALAKTITNDKKTFAIGTTSVTMRVALIREPNRFGLALAQALKARAPATATAVEAALKDRLMPDPRWSAIDSAYVQAITAVRVAQLAYDTAMGSTDTAVQRQAWAVLQNAKAAANGAAAGANRELPFPGLTSELQL